MSLHRQLSTQLKFQNRTVATFYYLDVAPLASRNERPRFTRHIPYLLLRLCRPYLEAVKLGTTTDTFIAAGVARKRNKQSFRFLTPTNSDHSYAVINNSLTGTWNVAHIFRLTICGNPDRKLVFSYCARHVPGTHSGESDLCCYVGSFRWNMHLFVLWFLNEAEEEEDRALYYYILIVLTFVSSRKRSLFTRY